MLVKIQGIVLETSDVLCLRKDAQKTVSVLFRGRKHELQFYVEDADAFCDEFAKLAIVIDLESKSIPPAAYVYYSDPGYEPDRDRWFQYPGKFVSNPESATKFADPGALDGDKWRDPTRGKLQCFSLIDAIKFNTYYR